MSDPINKNNTDALFSELLKNTEEPFNPSAWELYLGAIHKSTHIQDPKPFRTESWKTLSFDRARSLLAVGLLLITFMGAVFLFKSGAPQNTRINSTDSIFVKRDSVSLDSFKLNTPPKKTEVKNPAIREPKSVPLKSQITPTETTVFRDSSIDFIPNTTPLKPNQINITTPADSTNRP